MEDFKKRLQKALVDQEKNQRQLADFLEITPQSLSRMLGSDKLNSDIMNKITQFLSVDLNFFNRDSNVKSSGKGQLSTLPQSEDVNYLKEIIKTKDEVIKSKDDLIETLKEKLKKK